MVLLLNLIFVPNDFYSFLSISPFIFYCLLNSECLAAYQLSSKIQNHCFSEKISLRNIIDHAIDFFKHLVWLIQIAR